MIRYLFLATLFSLTSVIVVANIPHMSWVVLPGILATLILFFKGVYTLYTGMDKLIKENNLYLVDRNNGWQEYFSFVEATCKSEGIPVPAIYYYNNDELNAYTISSGKKSIVAISSGLLKACNLQEIEAVTVHELSHIKNRDGFKSVAIQSYINGMRGMFSRNRKILKVLAHGTVANHRNIEAQIKEKGYGSRAQHETLSDMKFWSLIFYPLYWAVSIFEWALTKPLQFAASLYFKHREFEADKLTKKYNLNHSLVLLFDKMRNQTYTDSDSYSKIFGEATPFSTHPSFDTRIKRLSA